jgi:MFS family permease
LNARRPPFNFPDPPYRSAHPAPIGAKPHGDVDGRKPRLGAIFLTIFLDLVGFGIVLPFLSAEARDTFGTSALTGALLGSVYSLAQFLFVPVWGRLSDRVGRRPVLVWSVAATMVGMTGLAVALAWGTSVAWLFAARVFSGIATANLGTASAYIADVTTPAERNRGMALIGIAFGLGFIIGPAIGGVLASTAINGRHGPVACFAAAALSGVNLVWVIFGLAESLPPERRAAAGSAKRSLTPLSPSALRSSFERPGVALAVGVNFLILLAFTNLDQTMRYFNEDLFGMSMKETGGLLAFIGIVAAFTQGGVRQLSKRFDEPALIRAGIALQAVAFAGISLSPSVGRWLLFASCGVLALGNGFTQPSVVAFISKQADASAQGGTLGTNQAFASLARVFGPAFGGWLYGAVGPRAPYVSAAIGMVVALVVAAPLARAAQPGSTSTQTS